MATLILQTESYVLSPKVMQWQKTIQTCSVIQMQNQYS